jgi:hypothetical protein
VPGKIEVSVAGEHVATLSAEEAALLANALWDLGTSTKRRGAITIAAALKAAAHRSGLKTSVDVKKGETRALHEALDGMTEHGIGDGLSGLSEGFPGPTAKAAAGGCGPQQAIAM